MASGKIEHMVVESGTVIGASGWTIGTRFCYKYGPIVSFSIYATGKNMSSNTDWVPVCSLPSNFSPKTSFDFISVENKLGIGVQFRITSSGSLDVYPTIKLPNGSTKYTVGDNLRPSYTYII